MITFLNFLPRAKKPLPGYNNRVKTFQLSQIIFFMDLDAWANRIFLLGKSKSSVFLVYLMILRIERPFIAEIVFGYNILCRKAQTLAHAKTPPM